MVGGNAVVAEHAFHACLLLVERKDIGEQVALGCGSIVTRSRILTAAHVVRGATGVQAGFYQRRVTPDQLRRVVALYVQPFQGHNSQTLENDLAIIVFTEYTFPSANVIRIAGSFHTTGPAYVAGYGFENAWSNSPSMLPLLASLTVNGVCSKALHATQSHFCAVANKVIVLCPGDNGVGLFKGTGRDMRLVSLTYA